MKKYLSFAGVLVVVAAFALVAVGSAYAADDDPPQPPFGGFGAGSVGFCGGNWGVFDSAADALGLTATELFEALHSGSTLAEIAESQGVDLEDLQAELDGYRQDMHRERIQIAVENGDITQEQADWMLEGMQQGFGPMGRGPARHGGHMGFPPFAE